MLLTRNCGSDKSCVHTYQLVYEFKTDENCDILIKFCVFEVIMRSDKVVFIFLHLLIVSAFSFLAKLVNPKGL